MAFGWDDAFLLSMTAAGAIIPLLGQQKKQHLIQQGRQLEKASIESNLEALRTESSESSLDAMKQLRENVSNQIVNNAARGVASGAGSAQTALQTAERNFNKDEQKRRLNLLVKENELRAQNVLSGLHTLTSETQMGQSLTNQIFNNLPIAALGSKYFPGSKGKAVGKKAGFGLDEV